ncbi:hypothetical protein X777_07513 [Ooceraea biroi]|uniref:Uncharacterized protein n=1 Tax=Ooceraea biroi TaxID=2015173 RepID=A0A026X3P2_OOCBI|nr:hypothetical protein X777_07513 [Ooceraea biroi]
MRPAEGRRPEATKKDEHQEEGRDNNEMNVAAASSSRLRGVSARGSQPEVAAQKPPFLSSRLAASLVERKLSRVLAEMEMDHLHFCTLRGLRHARSVDEDDGGAECIRRTPIKSPRPRKPKLEEKKFMCRMTSPITDDYLDVSVLVIGLAKQDVLPHSAAEEPGFLTGVGDAQVWVVCKITVGQFVLRDVL